MHITKVHMNNTNDITGLQKEFADTAQAADNSVGFWDRLKAGNIDDDSEAARADPNSAFNRWNPRGAEAQKKSQPAVDRPMAADRVDDKAKASEEPGLGLTPQQSVDTMKQAWDKNAADEGAAADSHEASMSAHEKDAPGAVVAVAKPVVKQEAKPVAKPAVADPVPQEPVQTAPSKSEPSVVEVDLTKGANSNAGKSVPTDDIFLADKAASKGLSAPVDKPAPAKKQDTVNMDSSTDSVIDHFKRWWNSDSKPAVQKPSTKMRQGN